MADKRGPSVGRLTADEARDLMDIKKESFDKTLYIIRQMCDATLRDASRRGARSAKFDIPVAVWGREGYDQRAMGKALAEQLYGDGFDVSGNSKCIAISWDRTANGKDDDGGGEISLKQAPVVSKKKKTDRVAVFGGQKHKKTERVLRINVA